MDQLEKSGSADTTPPSTEELRSAILAFLDDNPLSLCSEIGDGIGAAWKAVSSVLIDLKKENLIVKHKSRKGFPQYSLPKKRSRTRVTHPPITDADVGPIYNGSDAGATNRLHNALNKLGTAGQIATLLLRAQKKSDRAKVYQGDWAGCGYGDKDDAIRELCKLLVKDPGPIQLWGWGTDEDEHISDVIYFELPQGQVSFHCLFRHEGPDYPHEWDGEKKSASRIIRFAKSLLPKKQASERAQADT